MVFLKALGFLSWMYLFSEECSPVVYPTSLIELELCNGYGYFTTLKNTVGIAACSDQEIFISLENETLVKVNSVHNMELVLQT